ncbi:MAG: zinc ribbon domain-containing protein [Flavobacterium sp.]|nr:zinc ribbon domain-containing protein [Flavobacterium sp.]
MPLKKSPNGGGTNADGTMSKKYCAYCYQNGSFTQPEMTVAEMQDFVRGKMKEMPFYIRIFTGAFVNGIPKLERWKA